MPRSRLPQSTIDALRDCLTDRELMDLAMSSRAYHFRLYKLTGVKTKEQATKMVQGLPADKFFVDPRIWYAGFAVDDYKRVVPELKRRLSSAAIHNQDS